MHKPGDGGELYDLWCTRAPDNVELQRIATSGTVTAPAASSGDGAAAGDDGAAGGNEEDDADDGNPKPNEAQRSLIGRRYLDTDDGKTWAVFAAGYDPETKLIVAYIYDTAATSDPESLLDCEYMSADELADGEEYEWLDGKPGRLVGDRHEEAAAAAAAADGEDDDDAPSDGALFAELELARISGAELGIGMPEDSGGSDSTVPVISLGDGFL